MLRIFVEASILCYCWNMCSQNHLLRAMVQRCKRVLQGLARSRVEVSNLYSWTYIQLLHLSISYFVLVCSLMYLFMSIIVFVINRKLLFLLDVKALCFWFLNWHCMKGSSPVCNYSLRDGTNLLLFMSLVVEILWKTTLISPGEGTYLYSKGKKCFLSYFPFVLIQTCWKWK